MTTLSRLGRPPRDPSGAARHRTYRFPPALDDRLAAAAAAAGRPAADLVRAALDDYLDRHAVAS